jgi:DNA polymerase (family X)
LFDTIADYLSLDGESTYRILAYSKAAALFREHPVSIAEMASRGELQQLPGVGVAIEAKVLDYISTGDLAVLQRLRSRYPEGLLEVMHLPGLGPAKTRLVWEATGVADVRDLKSACEQGRVRDIPGMGEKTEAKILAAIKTWEAKTAAGAEPRRLRTQVEPHALRLVEALRSLPAVVTADYAGSLRRLRSTVRDIDLAVASTDAGAVMDAFAALPEISHVEERGDTKLVTRTHSGLNVDLRIVPPASYGNLLQHLTGGADHNEALRGYAKRRGYKISEYDVEHVESGRRTTCATEGGVYETVGLSYIAPELRENQGEIEAAEAGSLPVLVEVPDVRGDLHVHSDWTDGRASLEQMALAARSFGLDYLCFCDHSQSLAMTGGLTPERVLAQIEEIRALDARLDGIRLLAGIEVDILADGRLDLPDDILARLDFVTASIHSGFSQTKDKLMERIVGAMRNPCVRSIAHPSGRLLGRRDGYEIDLDTLAQVAVETGTYLEINGSPDRLDLNAQSARRAVALGATVVISSDSHRTGEFENLRQGVAEARRGWLRALDIANCRPWDAIREAARR